MGNQGAIKRKTINLINQVFHEHPSDLLRILENPERLFSEVFMNSKCIRTEVFRLVNIMNRCYISVISLFQSHDILLLKEKFFKLSAY